MPYQRQSSVLGWDFLPFSCQRLCHDHASCQHCSHSSHPSRADQPALKQFDCIRKQNKIQNGMKDINPQINRKFKRVSVWMSNNWTLTFVEEARWPGWLHLREVWLIQPLTNAISFCWERNCCNAWSGKGDCCCILSHNAWKRSDLTKYQTHKNN